jgi:hypothetical protein
VTPVGRWSESDQTRGVALFGDEDVPWWTRPSPSPREFGLRCNGVIGWYGEHERAEQSGEIGCEDEMPGLFFL